MALNIASEIIGAIIILIIIDKKFKKEEVSELKTRANNLLLSVKYIFSPDFKFLLGYSKVLGHAIEVIIPKSYVHRENIENICMENMNSGLYIYGHGGIGKTVLLQMVVFKQIKKFLNSPENEITPILIYAGELNEDGLLESIQNKINRFRSIKKNRLKNLLIKKKIVLVIDGLDEALHPGKILSELSRLRTELNNFPLIISSRNKLEFPIIDKKIELKELSIQESLTLINKLRDEGYNVPRTKRE